VPVILKALNCTLQGTPDHDLERTLIENFQNEAAALDAVRHANIVRRLGHGTAADLAGLPFHYLVLEYLGGGDLMARCRRRPLSLDETLGYVRQICDALAVAHEHSVIHRDIKPQNLLLTADGSRVKITDFGVAKLNSRDTNAEVTRVGTDFYAPPEHNPLLEPSGGAERLTPAADVYSLAKTVYALLAGAPPREYARRPITGLPPSLASQPWADRLLDVLCRATADQVSQRYQSVREFWEQLASVTCEDDDTTRVRARSKATFDYQPARPAAAPVAHFATPVAGTPRIFVTVDSPAPRPPAQSARPPATPEPREEGYSYREDLKDLVGSGWRLRAVIVAAILTLLLSVTAVYFEVQRYVRLANAPQGTVTAQQLRLRSQPGGETVGTLPKGTRVRILGQASDRAWLEVEVIEWSAPVDAEQPDRGWVSANFVALDH
jgi:serine/threonine protein kinase